MALFVIECDRLPYRNGYPFKPEQWKLRILRVSKSGDILDSDSCLIPSVPL
ncbi:MAG: hypothetical protein AB1589_18365 [Cyanobacteriota bacterium]